MSKLLVLSLLAVGMDAAEYCSLYVRVQTPSGEEVDTRVTVEEQNGWKAEQTTKRGPAKFCGLGIHPVSVTVGDSGCNQVIVRNVPLSWNETRNLLVTYDKAPCNVDTPLVAACGFLLRFVATDHDAIGAVTFQAQKPYVESDRGDEYGRVFVRIAAGQELFGVGSASGYKPAEIRIPCVSKNKRLEQIVVMEKTGQ